VFSQDAAKVLSLEVERSSIPGTFKCNPLPFVSDVNIAHVGIDVVAAWVPSEAPKFENSKAMNLFKDNIDYTVKTFKDLKRLNEQVHTVPYHSVPRLFPPN